jgi:proteic killer suppression protein
MAIQSFASKTVEKFFTTGTPPRKEGWSPLAAVALRKLDMVEYANALGDLRAPPGNRLETLTGKLAGWHAIRINDQWRIIFRWTERGPADLDIVDYHQ